jgi:hypothetical protein
VLLYLFHRQPFLSTFASKQLAMSDDENSWKWEAMVKICNNIHKMRGIVRTEMAKDALGFIKDLRQNEFLISSKERYELYETLLLKIAVYLDGNIDVIQSTVREYFLIQHLKAGIDEDQFDVSFSPKTSGIQTGFTCDISDGTQTTRYFIKTHQHGPTDDNPESLKPPDPKEVFIYQLLQHVGIGPMVHFIVPSHGSKRPLYIATKDCSLLLLSHMTKESANFKALVQLDSISRILCLSDCATNTSNCGQVDGKPMIVDFRIEKTVGRICQIGYRG